MGRADEMPGQKKNQSNSCNKLRKISRVCSVRIGSRLRKPMILEHVQIGGGNRFEPKLECCSRSKPNSTRQ